MRVTLKELSLLQLRCCRQNLGRPTDIRIKDVFDYFSKASCSDSTTDRRELVVFISDVVFQLDFKLHINLF